MLSVRGGYHGVERCGVLSTSPVERLSELSLLPLPSLFCPGEVGESANPSGCLAAIFSRPHRKSAAAAVLVTARALCSQALCLRLKFFMFILFEFLLFGARLHHYPLAFQQDDRFDRFPWVVASSTVQGSPVTMVSSAVEVLRVL